MTPDHPAEAPEVDLAAIRAHVENDLLPSGALAGMLHFEIQAEFRTLLAALDAQAERLARVEEERDAERLGFATAKRAYALDGERLAAEAAEQRGRAERAVETGQAILEAFHINVPGHAGRWSTCPSRLCVNYRRALAALAPPEPAS